MSQNTCHYCLEIKDDMSIKGQYRVKNGKYICYQLCNKCSKLLIGINTHTDKQARQTFLTTVKNNAKIKPILE